jgi:chorismate synthase
MSHNSFGHLFRVTTWGESHGPALGCIVDGTPPGIGLTEADIQPWLDRRRPGTSKFVTQRQESDQVRILSGVFADERTAGQVTTGTPIEEIQGITCACPVTAVVRGDLSTALPCCKACPVETTKPPE